MEQTAVKPTRIIIPLSGIAAGTQQPRAVFDPLSRKVLEAIGTVSTQRASNVETGHELSQAALRCIEPTHAEQIGATPGVLVVGDVFCIKPEFAEHWFADMTPCGHLVVLGPYPPGDREVALREEVVWLQQHNVPVCQTCMTSPYSQHKPTGRTSSQDPEMQFILPNVQHLRVPFPKIERQILAECDFSAVEQQVRDHYRTEVADKCRAGVLGSFSGVTAVNGWEHDGDTLRCAVFREDGKAIDDGVEDPPSVKWTFTVTFIPGQCRVADIRLRKVLPQIVFQSPACDPYTVVPDKVVLSFSNPK